MRMHFITAATLALLATGGTAMADKDDMNGHSHAAHDGKRWAQHDRRSHAAGDPERMLRHLANRLELEQTQRQTIENIVTAAQPEMEALRERAANNRMAIQQLDPAAADHATRLNQLAAEKGAIAAEQARLHGKLRADVHAVLTPGQRETLAEQAGKKRERGQKHKSRSRG